jgi:cAMP-specific phosphodiesterase
MLRPITTATTLRELLEEQREVLERARVMPAKNYLTCLDPVRSPSADASRSQRASQKAALRPLSPNTRLHDVAVEVADIADDRCDKRKECSADERAALTRLLASLHRLDPTLFTPFIPVQPTVIPPESLTLTAKPHRRHDGLTSLEGSTRTDTRGDTPLVGGLLGLATPEEFAVRPVSSEHDMDSAAEPEQASPLTPPTPAHAKGGAGLGSFRFMRQLKKLQAVSSTPAVYKNMVQSREAVEALFKFSTHCSEARLGSDEVLRVMELDLAAFSQARSCAILTRSVDGWQRGLSTKFQTDAMTQSSVFSAVPPDLDDITRAGSQFRDSDRVVLTIRADGEIIGAAELLGVPGGADVQLLDNMAHVAGMFMRNNNSFLESKWQRRKAEAMLEMARSLAEENLEEERLARTIMTFTLELIEADSSSLYIVGNQHNLVALSTVFTETADGAVEHEATVAGGRSIANIIVATKELLIIDDAHADERFDKLPEIATGRRSGAVLGIPVVFEGRLVAVQLLIRQYNAAVDTKFHERDVELLRTFSTFVGVCLRNCRVNAAMLLEKRKSEAILHVVRDMNNCDIRDVQSVVSQVLTGAKRLLNADRASLFLVDKERHELYSKIADDTGGQVIRFPIGRGIAGTVAKSGVAENISDAYADPRFNKAIDVSLGYVTKSMLTEAIFFQDEVIAVAQLVNKLESNGRVGVFTAQDEETFRAFSLFAGISLRNSHLLNFAIDAGREAMELQEVRDGRRRARQHEATLRNDVSEAVVSHIMNQIDIDADILDRIKSRNFSLFDIREQMENCYDVCVKIVLELVSRTGYLDEFKCPRDVFCRFILACRDKYRNVPYHNFYHAVDVCQTVHTFIHEGRATTSISRLDEFVLLVTALVHDLDHMGLNNSFHLKTDSPLGMLSSASGNNSVLEVHHCNLAIEILNDPAKNVFIGLTRTQKTQAYRRLIDCVLATDMQRHNDVVNDFVAIDTFDVSNEIHVTLACKMLLKAADISNVSKPFAVSRKWGMSVTEEFYQQGDKEKEKGVVVLPMFDRSLNNELAKGQIGFIDFIAMPFFRKLSDRFVGLRWTVENITSNKAAWTAVLGERRASKT